MSAKKIVLVGVVVLGLGGAAAAVARPDWFSFLGLGQERAVRKRAEGYWNARLANDMKAMAPFAHPLQKTLPENKLLTTETYEITDIKIEGDEAMVAVKAKYKLKLGEKLNTVNRELDHQDHWVRYKGEWYHALHPVGLGEILHHGLGKWKPPVDPNAGAGKAQTQ
jgi:hypothetical protein